MKSVGIFLLLLVMVSSAVAQSKKPPQRSSMERKRQLADLYADYWRTEYKKALEDHQASSSSPRSVFVAYSKTKDSASLKNTSFRDALLNRRRDLFLHEAVFHDHHHDAKLNALEESITREEGNFRYKVADKQNTRAELSNLGCRQSRPPDS